MRQRLLTTLGHWAGEKTWWMLLIVTVVTLFFGALSGQLEMSMSLTEILPGDDPMVEEFNYIFKEFNGASTIYVVAEGRMEDMIKYAEHVSPIIRDLDGWIETNASEQVMAEHKTGMDKVAAGKIEFAGQYIKRVDYKQPLDFIKDHGIMLIKSSDLENTQEIFSNPNLLPLITNLNNSLEKEYIQSEEKISTTQREQMAVRYLDGIESWLDYLDAALNAQDYNPGYSVQAAEAVAIGSPYLVSPDRSMLVIAAEPTFNIMEMDFLMPCINGMEELVKQEAEKFNVTAGLTGSLALGRDEMVAGTEDSMLLTLLALVAVFILFVFTFKMLSSPILAMLNLIIGIVWAMGFSYFLVESLNMFTVFMSVILVGLGIDFSVHIISVFSELINKGIESKKAMVETLQKVGGGIITGGFTTACAFLTLMIARSDGMSEFGLVCGMGLIIIMISTLLTLPMMLMLREKYRAWRKKEIKAVKDVSYRSVGNLSTAIYNKWKFSLISVLMVTIFFGYMVTKITMDYNYLNMEPEGLESILLNEKMIEKFNFSSDMTMMTARSLEENRAFTEAAKDKSSISYVESISDYLPIDSDQRERIPDIVAISNGMRNKTVDDKITSDEWDQLKVELDRLGMNLIEMQDLAFTGGQDMVDVKATRLVGNPDQPDVQGKLFQLLNRLEAEPVELSRLSQFNRDFGRTYKALVLDMADTSRITVDSLPEIIRDKYISRKGDRFLMTIYPKGNVWHIDYLETFFLEASSITPSLAGTPPMFYYLLKILGADGRRAALLTLAVVFVFLLLDFRSFKLAILAMIPLLFGMIWMVGFMGMTGIQLTLLNIMALPLIIGIGIDDGVHLMHRYKHEGKGSVFTVFSSTGKAITITSLTTMLAFGSLVFATYRGFGSLGIALFIGVGTCLLASVFILPGLLGMFERNIKK